MDKEPAYKKQLQTESIVGNIQREPTIEYTIAQEGIEKYIETPCIEACKKLWDLNITTFESSGTDRGGWIAIYESKLSEENKRRLEEYIEAGIEGYSDEITGKEFSGIEVLNVNSEYEVSSKLLDLTNIFEMQDVKDGVYTKEVYLSLECGCANYSIENNGNIAIEFDPKRMEKTFEEYLFRQKSDIYPR
jgi:hypothetical protein